MAKQMLIKRRGHREQYDERKVYASVYAACLAAQEPEEVAEDIAQRTAKQITRWITGRKTTTSDDIFRQVIVELGKPLSSRALARGSYKAAFLYERHRDIG